MNNSKEATLISILQNIRALDPNNIQHGPNSTAIALVESVKSDGKLNQKDINELVYNQTLDQDLAGNKENIFNKIIYTLQSNPELAEEIEEYATSNQLNIEELFTPDTLLEFGQLIESMLQAVDKFGKGGQFESINHIRKVTINNKDYELLVFKTEEERMNGLSKVEEMNENEGGLFDFVNDPQKELSFWMKDTTIPLDVIFVDNNTIVINVQQGIPMSEDLLTCTSEDNPITWVIELNTNSGVKVGDEVKGLKFDISELDPSKLHVLNEDGTVQASIDSNARIFSRRSTSVMIKKAKKAFESKSDVDYKDLGRYVFGELDRQDNRPSEYVDSPDNKEVTNAE